MEKTRYYRFETGKVILRRKGNRVEKFGKDGAWIHKPSLLSRFMNGQEGLVEISEQEAMELIDAHQACQANQ